MITDKFKDTALSFAGCDGGNLKSDVWFCGLEWGGEQKNTLDPAIDENSVYSWSHEDFDGSWLAQYNQKICWFLWYFYSLEWNNGENSEVFVKHHHILYNQQENGIGFKMNMLPIGFPNRNNIDWNETLQKLTGLKSFNEYREWCVIHRGKFFRNAVRKYQPKVIICTGITETDRFIRFFTAEEEYETVMTEQFKFHYAKFENTLICVVPFFGGANGINSYAKMENLVAEVKDLLKT
ncbi:hypothetical protein [Aggregatibacter actinomycetemcomitans]|nr:hypothetical protein [Aggregatibacter actinomycetemcomitans]KOE62848.1 hypothetical protein A160_0210200 [Aggregatibacter actinomycetemcomitans serotype e str. A160]KOE69083.1 hypothetical protein D18P1_0310515 [Aggregatibacter actinomycetemcomitans serotype f str. D18P1]KYK73820.1 hypothetical protein SA2876_09250 [Aggregatibacter actinomycetemcomitans serotype e str. SA2876]KYK85541.1 hypothetical protein SC29R_11110 [Aggregatibacter actinomycetemcomitans serotype f str. SC29R]